MIKPIGTIYNGYKFRSRLEARWAIFFDAIGLKYEYEIKGFQMGKYRYLPDFWLPDWKCWVEIKPDLPTEIELLKIRKLWEEKNREEGVFIICGQPYLPYLSLKQNWEFDHFNGYIILAFNKAITKDIPTSGEMPLVYELFAMCDGGNRLDIWPIYLKNDAKNGYYFSPIYPQGLMERLYIGNGVEYNHSFLINAYKKARQARFEYNQNNMHE